MKGLPKVTVSLADGRLGQSQQTADGIAGMILTGAAVSGKIQLGTPIQIFSLNEAKNQGITENGTNAYAYKQVKQFYDQTGSGAALWLMLVAQSVTMEQMADGTKNYAPALLNAAKGQIRLLGISRKSAAGVTISNGLDADVDKAAVNAQSLSTQYAKNYQDFSVIIDGKDFNGKTDNLKDYTTDDKQFVSIYLSNADGSKNADIGLLLGRLAKDPVQRSPGRVRSGPLPMPQAYFTSKETVESIDSAWDTLHDKGYIFLRYFIGRAGYFFSDGSNCTQASSDLNRIPRVRTLYKARRLAYQVFAGNILEEIPLEPGGQIAPALIKSWQAQMDTALNQQMTAQGEISGARTQIDPHQDVLGTNEMKVRLDVQPVGYARYISVELGFKTNIN